MNKSKIILSATGGVIGLLVLVMAYFVWSSFSAKTAAIEGDDEEGVDGLETVVGQANQLSRKPVFPCAASVREIESNRTQVAEWKDEAFKLASRGDRPVKKLTPPQFKNDMLEAAKALLALPGGVQGKIAKPEFAFGPFREYIAEGKMPSEAKLPELQRQWDDLTTLMETLAGCGVSEVLDIQLKQAEEKKEEAEKGNRRTAKRNVRKAKGDEAEAKGPAAFTYVVTFMTRPIGLVKTVNALETCERFAVVGGFTFTREKDVIAEALGGDEKKAAEQQATGRRGRRRGRAVQEEEKKEEDAKGGIITDPLLDAPLKVEMTVSIYDFRTMEEEKKTEEEKK